VSFAELPSLGIKDPRLRQMVELMSAEGILDRVPAKGLAEMHRLSDSLKKQLPHMRTPTLILHSREDDLSAPRNACYIRRHIGAPSELRWVDDSYHMIHIDRQYREVADTTADFFEAGHAPGRY
jgi:carboxylesterase